MCIILTLQKFAPESAPLPDEVTDLQQRLTLLQGKRAEDKTKIKELERYKAQLNQVRQLVHVLFTSVQPLCVCCADDGIQGKVERVTDRATATTQGSKEGTSPHPPHTHTQY